MRTKMPDVIDAYIQTSNVEMQTGLGVCSQRMPSFTTRDRNIAALWRSGNGATIAGVGRAGSSICSARRFRFPSLEGRTRQAIRVWTLDPDWKMGHRSGPLRYRLYENITAQSVPADLGAMCVLVANPDVQHADLRQGPCPRRTTLIAAQ
jgi:hypothetical protein